MTGTHRRHHTAGAQRAVPLLLIVVLAATACGLFAAPDPTPTPEPTYRPTGIPTDVNPLTGLKPADPSVLARSPLLVKVSNESSMVRPQSGLSFADHVWEYQMEGWQQTRYTAIFYSRAPERVGSVRSVRPIDTDLIVMYDGLLVFSGASNGMWEIVSSAPWVYRAFAEDADHIYTMRDPTVPREGIPYYHSLFALPERVWEAADQRGINQRPDLEHMAFDEAAPPGGVETSEAAIDYPYLGPKHIWRTDEEGGRWLSWTEDQAMRVPEAPDVDYLTGEQLAFDNVVILFAEHFLTDFIEDEPNQLYGIAINLIGEGDAVLLRDGQRYVCRWRRDDAGDMIRLIDSNGRVIPFRPGTIWFNVASVDEHRPEITLTP